MGLDDQTIVAKEYALLSSLIHITNHLGIKDLDIKSYPDASNITEMRGLKNLIDGGIMDSFIKKEFFSLSEPDRAEIYRTIFRQFKLQSLAPLETAIITKTYKSSEIKSALEMLSPITLFYLAFFIMKEKFDIQLYWIADLMLDRVIEKTQSVAAFILSNNIKFLLRNKSLDQRIKEINNRIPDYFRKHIGDFFGDSLDDMKALLNRVLFSPNYERKIKNLQFLVQKFPKIAVERFSAKQIKEKHNAHLLRICAQIDIERQFMDIGKISFDEFLKLIDEMQETITFLEKNSSFSMKDWKIEKGSTQKIENLTNSTNRNWQELSTLHNKLDTEKSSSMRQIKLEKLKELYYEKINWLFKQCVELDQTLLSIDPIAFVFPLAYWNTLYAHIDFSQKGTDLTWIKTLQEKIKIIFSKFRMTISDFKKDKNIIKPELLVNVNEFLETLSKFITVTDLEEVLSGKFPEPIQTMKNQLIALSNKSTQNNLIDGYTLQMFAFKIKFEKINSISDSKKLISFFAVISKFFEWNRKEYFPLLPVYELFLVFEKDNRLEYFSKLGLTIINHQYQRIPEIGVDKEKNRIKESFLSVIDIFYEKRKYQSRFDEKFMTDIGIQGFIQLYEKGILRYFVGRLIVDGCKFWKDQFSKGFDTVCEMLTKETSEKTKVNQAYDIFPYKKCFEEKFKDTEISFYAFAQISNIKTLVKTGLKKESEYNLFDVVGIEDKLFWTKIIEYINYPIITDQIKELIAVARVMSLCPESFRHALLYEYSLIHLISKHALCFAEKTALFRPSLLQLFLYQKNQGTLKWIEGKSDEEAYKILYPTSVYPLAASGINREAIIQAREEKNESECVEKLSHASPTSGSNHLLKRSSGSLEVKELDSKKQRTVENTVDFDMKEKSLANKM